MMALYPGTAKRFTCTAYGLTGQLQSLTLTFEVRSQDGKTVISGTVVQDTDPVTGLPSVGSNYADVLIPVGAPPGFWSEHWQATNAMVIDQNQNEFRKFQVLHPPR